MDKLTTLELLEYILDSIHLIQKRFDIIKTAEDFNTELGQEKLDSICMRLQTIGESIKILDKKDRDFLNKIESDNYWSNMIKLREIISHHYAQIDEEIVYDICNEKITTLESKIAQLLTLVE